MIHPGTSQIKKKPTGNARILEKGTAQIQPITARAFQMTSRLICLNHATLDEPKTTDPCPDCSTVYPNMTFLKLSTPPIAIMSAATHTTTIPASTAPAFVTDRHDFVPAHAETSQSGNRNARRSGLNPLPMPSATAPQYANRFSPFQQRQQQYAVSNEKSARFGRSGPSRVACQKTGFTSRRNAAAAPAHGENILPANAYAAHNDAAPTSNDTAT